MKTKLKQLAATVLIVLATTTATTAHARTIALPDPAAVSVASGTFRVNAMNQITLTGSPVSLTTARPSHADTAGGSARFARGSLAYKDGTTSVDGRISRVVFGRQINNGQVIYTIKGLVHGKLTQGTSALNVNGSFSVSTKAAPEGTTLAQAQVDTSQLLLTTRSKLAKTARIFNYRDIINNLIPLK